jgi:hypothetical protein
MKRFLGRLGLAAALVLLAFALTPSANARQGEQNPTAPTKPGSPTAPAEQADEAQMPASGEVTTEEAKSFSGIVTKENNALTLKDPVTKVSYKLDDPAKAKQYLGKRVKVTGKLDTNRNTILINSIKPAS